MRSQRRCLKSHLVGEGGNNTAVRALVVEKETHVFDRRIARATCTTRAAHLHLLLLKEAPRQPPFEAIKLERTRLHGERCHTSNPIELPC